MQRHPFAAAFSLVELLIVTLIIGVLVALLLPAIALTQHALYRTQCSSNLRQQGIALHHYHDNFSVFPPAKINSGAVITDSADRPLRDFYGNARYEVLNHTGFTLLLPYLDEENLYRQWDPRTPSSVSVNATAQNAGYWPAPMSGNEAVVGAIVSVYHCPGDTEPITETWFNPSDQAMQNARRSNYAFCINSYMWEECSITDPNNWVVRMIANFGEYPFVPGVFAPNICRSLSDIEDGACNTIAIGERKQDDWGGSAHWGVGAFGSVTSWIRVELNPMPIPINGGQFGSVHPNGANFLFADGSVRFLRDDPSFVPAYAALGTINLGSRNPAAELPLLNLE